jgi:hypothetical protein
MPNGFVDPLTCNRAKCNNDTPNNTKGNKKCKTKKRFNVGLSTLKPPHNQLTIYFPIIGNAPKIFVITVAPQRLICPHGSV